RGGTCSSCLGGWVSDPHAGGEGVAGMRRFVVSVSILFSFQAVPAVSGAIPLCFPSLVQNLPEAAQTCISFFIDDVDVTQQLPPLSRTYTLAGLKISLGTTPITLKKDSTIANSPQFKISQCDTCRTFPRLIVGDNDPLLSKSVDYLR